MTLGAGEATTRQQTPEMKETRVWNNIKEENIMDDYMAFFLLILIH